MNTNNYPYNTEGGICVSRTITKVPIESTMTEILSRLDSYRGGLFSSSYEYPGRYKRWGIGFVNPPLELATCGDTFTLTALNERGIVLVSYLAKHLYKHPELQSVVVKQRCIIGSIQRVKHLFSEEERSKQPSVFSIVREILRIFHSPKDDHLGLYGAFGYDLVFQFEPMPHNFERLLDQRDLLLYLPDELVLFDYYLQHAFCLQYEFDIEQESTKGLPRCGEVIDYKGKRCTPAHSSDHAPGEYANLVCNALDYFKRGDLLPSLKSATNNAPASRGLFPKLVCGLGYVVADTSV